MKFFKFLMMLIVQLPISVFYYLEPTNPIYFLIYQALVTWFLFMIDNAVSVNYHNILVMQENFEELLEKILKAIPKNPKESFFEGEE